MTANVEVARQDAVISRVPGGTLQPRPASRQRDAMHLSLLQTSVARA